MQRSLAFSSSTARGALWGGQGRAHRVARRDLREIPGVDSVPGASAAARCPHSHREPERLPRRELGTRSSSSMARRATCRALLAVAAALALLGAAAGAKKKYWWNTVRAPPPGPPPARPPARPPGGGAGHSQGARRGGRRRLRGSQARGRGPALGNTGRNSVRGCSIEGPAAAASPGRAGDHRRRDPAPKPPPAFPAGAFAAGSGPLTSCRSPRCGPRR